MSRVALPRIGGILETRNNRIAGDLAEAGRLKQETDAAVAAYEQALAEARQNAHGIGQKARDAAKAAADADRKRIEAELQGKLDAAETRIGEVKSRRYGEVDAIANDAAEAIVESAARHEPGQAGDRRRRARRDGAKEPTDERDRLGDLLGVPRVPRLPRRCSST